MNVSTKEKVEVHNFETLKYNLIDNNGDILLDNWCDLVRSFFTNVQSLNMSYFLPVGFHNVLMTFYLTTSQLYISMLGVLIKMLKILSYSYLL